MNRFRRILVRWDKSAANYIAFLHFACALIALLTLEMIFKLFLKMYDNRSYGKESFESSYQLEGSSPVPSLGAVPNGLEAEGHRRGHGGDQRGSQPMAETSQGRRY
jgi:hypothetical protein